MRDEEHSSTYPPHLQAHRPMPHLALGRGQSSSVDRPGLHDLQALGSTSSFSCRESSGHETASGSGHQCLSTSFRLQDRATISSEDEEIDTPKLAKRRDRHKRPAEIENQCASEMIRQRCCWPPVQREVDVSSERLPRPKRFSGYWTSRAQRSLMLESSWPSLSLPPPRPNPVCQQHLKPMESLPELPPIDAQLGGACGTQRLLDVLLENVHISGNLSESVRLREPGSLSVEEAITSSPAPIREGRNRECLGCTHSPTGFFDVMMVGECNIDDQACECDIECHQSQQYGGGGGCARHPCQNEVLVASQTRTAPTARNMGGWCTSSRWPHDTNHSTEREEFSAVAAITTQSLYFRLPVVKCSALTSTRIRDVERMLPELRHLPTVASTCKDASMWRSPAAHSRHHQTC